jgi:hypothetical protein
MAKTKPTRTVRLLHISTCHQCRYKSYDSCYCGIATHNRMLPADRIPDWCPLPVAKPKEQRNGKAK